MEPPRSHRLASDADQQGIHNQGGDDLVAYDDNTITMWDIMQEYIHIDVNIITCVAAPAVVPMNMDAIDVDDNAPRTQHEDDDVVLALYQPGQHDCAKTQEERTELGLAAQPMGRTFYSKNLPSAGYKMPLPPPLSGSINSKMFVAAAAADPLQLSIGTQAPAANHMPGSSSSNAFSRYKGNGISLNNLLPPEKKTVAAIPNNTSPSFKPLYERPLLDLIGKKDPPPFAPVILESSEVAEAAVDYQLHEFCHGGARCKNIMAPAKANHKRRRYIWPAEQVARLDEKIEQLRKEALLRPAHRRSMILIEKDIDELQGKKNEIHARMMDMMREDDDGDVRGSTQQ